MWVMQNLGIEDGENVTVTLVELPAAKFAKLQPHSNEFLSIQNPKTAYVSFYY